MEIHKQPTPKTPPNASRWEASVYVWRDEGEVGSLAQALGSAIPALERAFGGETLLRLGVGLYPGREKTRVALQWTVMGEGPDEGVVAEILGAEFGVERVDALKAPAWV